MAAMKITVGIKALNEQRHIEDCIASALEAVRPFQGEVVVADSGSTDNTIPLAQQFPVRIFQLANPAERSCGTGAQLAFQHSHGEYFYILDGDMVMDPQFLSWGIAYLEANPNVAGVGGRVRQMNTQSEEYQIRASTGDEDPNWTSGSVEQLDCGGLYRADVVRGLGYFSDRNLHAFEEFELAARLQAAGWKLARINARAVDHYGHTIGGYRLLLKWLRTGYAGAPGEVLHAAVGQPQLSIVMQRLSHIRNALIVVVWWCFLLLNLLRPSLLILLLLAPLAFLTLRRGSLSLGLYSYATWNVNAWGFLTGLFKKRVDPKKPIDSVDLTARTAAARIAQLFPSAH